ncbi:DUF3108 domain-containing protein [Paraburkholderia sp. MMS20-SJTR3]|uniref:DUF3108 domain-containing protein n=1 Tax=Paraburkholderia sejongensis TaxID=2886946 RepID=A0ABS8JQE9_9BURK|nr:DUF3108 domain-containing protein [Paraburkholderia sp. MMS20-SJTR3]MCC8392144.1 DUF3108 domain-containing protein [Paraburkholderia sp. MMS20-SJTR3]
MDFASATRRPDSQPPADNGPGRTSRTRRTRRAWRAGRWLAVLAVVAVSHWIAAQWFERNRMNLNPAEHQRVPVQIKLLTPERVERQQQPAAAPPQPPAPVHKPAAPRPHEQHVLSALQPAKPDQPAATPASEAAASAPLAASGANAAAAAAANANGNGASTPAAASAPQASKGVKFSVPPSADLEYDTFYNGVRNPPGTIHWASNAQGYEMIVSVPVPFVGPFVYSSRGGIDAFGLAPAQYSEKRGRRAEDIAIFNRNDRKIAFTRTPATLPLPDGAQDRFSVVMQLASLVRGDPGAYTPGVTREFFVVDNDSGENWPIETIGDETIRAAQGYLQARHFKRLPRHEGDQRRIDVWLAPSLGWLPARILQTEPNGTQFELVWRGKLELDSAMPSDGANGGATPGAAAPAVPAPAAPAPATPATPATATPGNASTPSSAPPPADASAGIPDTAPAAPVGSTARKNINL